MKFMIFRKDENIFVNKDFSDVKDKGEVGHILVELELLKVELLDLWQELDEDENE